MKFKKNVISNLILHALTIGIGFLTSVLIARGLGTENQGQFSYYVLIFGLIASYGHIGITSSTSYFLKRTKFKKDEIINNNISVLSLLSIVYIVVAIIFRNNIFSNDIYMLVVIWSIYAMTLLFNNFLITLYVAEENIYVFNRFFSFTYILKGIIIVVLYYTNNLNIVTLSILYVLLEIIKIVLLVKGIKLKYKFYIDIKLLKEELKYGIPLYLAALFIYLNYRVDQLMVKGILNDSELGIYSIAVQLAELAFVFSDSIKTAFEGRLYSCKKEERKQVSAQIIKFAFFSTLAICIIGMLCKPLVNIIYGVEYEKAGTTMVILLIGIIFVSIGKVAPAYFCTEGRPRIHLVVASIVLVINLVFNTILIPKLGINGAAIASTISYCFYGVIYVLMLQRDGITPKQLFIITKTDLKELKESLLKRIHKKENKNEPT